MTLSYKDERDLFRFFSESGHSQRSIQGPILDKLILMSVKHTPLKNAITARPTRETREEPRSEMDIADIELFGRVSRKLAMIKSRHREVLEAFHGDDGACCAERLKRHGRIASLLRFTKAGRDIIARERKRTKLKLSVSELIQNVVGKQETQPSPAGAASLAEALSQSLDLKEEAEAAYTNAGAELASRRPPQQRAMLLKVVRG